MKKVVSFLLICIIIFNFIFVNMSYAEDSTGESESKVQLNQNQLDSLINDGKTEGENSMDIQLTQSITGNVIGMVAQMIDVFPMIAHEIITGFANQGGLLNSGSHSIGGIEITTGISSALLTVEKVIFGQYYMLSVDNEINNDNLSQKRANKEILVISQDLTKGLISIRETTYLWYYILRIIAILISLLTLIYIGIRIAVTSVAAEQARYKKMLLGWVESLFIILILPYIVTIVLKLNNLLVGWAVTIKDSLIASGDQSFEAKILEQIFGWIKTKGGLTIAMYSLVYWFLVFVELKFFFLYIKRVFVVAFLIIISPLITVTYPIDKAGDGQAQAFVNWFKEFLITVFIQTVHVFTYLIFMFLAGNIAETVPILGIAFLFALPKIEKIVKVIFNLTGAVAIKDFNDMLKKK